MQKNLSFEELLNATLFKKVIRNILQMTTASSKNSVKVYRQYLRFKMQLVHALNIDKGMQIFNNHDFKQSEISL